MKNTKPWPGSVRGPTPPHPPPDPPPPRAHDAEGTPRAPPTPPPHKAESTKKINESQSNATRFIFLSVFLYKESDECKACSNAEEYNVKQ